MWSFFSDAGIAGVGSARWRGCAASRDPRNVRPLSLRGTRCPIDQRLLATSASSSVHWNRVKRGLISKPPSEEGVDMLEP